MKRLLSTLLLYGTLQIFCIPLRAQNSPALHWYDPSAMDYPVIQGRGWQTGLESPYDRLPLRSKESLRPPVWNLSTDAAGLRICFKTSSNSLVIRYTVQGNQSMAHMPSTGVSGVDLYARDVDGNWRWARGTFHFGDTIEYRFSNLSLSAKEEEFTLYLPLYTKVLWMNIGLPSEASFRFFPAEPEQPIVAYGTSIMQGACASRPGLAWTNILERKIDHPVINLGFSGNGQLEPALLDLMNEMDARLYILDCMPNLIASEKMPSAEIHDRILKAVDRLREKHPQTPILLVGHCCGLPMADMDSSLSKKYKATSDLIAKSFSEIQASGIRQIFLLTDEAIRFDGESTVDGTHPNDIGMMKYADAYESILRKILHEEKGNLKTTIPIRQRRDYATYDFMQRHQAVLETVKSSRPDVLLIGNSITHFWGGLPESTRHAGAASWQKYWDPLHTVNLGFGWDRVENVLWRVYHGELDGGPVKKILLTIGTNNLSVADSDHDILEGLRFLVNAIRQRQPAATVYLSGIYPRRNMEYRVTKINQGIAKLAESLHIPYVNPGLLLLGRDAKINEALFSDGLHPNEEGYEKLGKALVTHFR